jgi:type VI secretion system protein ImpA
MPSAQHLDIDHLVAPISGDDPAGSPVSFVVRQQLDEARKSVDPASFAPDDPLRPEQFVPADWRGIIGRTTDLLGSSSKDLLLAARLSEALLKAHGFGGLRDGLALLRRLIADCWDRLNPPIEDGDLDVRAAPFNWLDDADRGARFPTSVRAAPVVAARTAPSSAGSTGARRRTPRTPRRWRPSNGRFRPRPARPARTRRTTSTPPWPS